MDVDISLTSLCSVGRLVLYMVDVLCLHSAVEIVIPKLSYLNFVCSWLACVANVGHRYVFIQESLQSKQ